MSDALFLSFSDQDQDHFSFFSILLPFLVSFAGIFLFFSSQEVSFESEDEKVLHRILNDYFLNHSCHWQWVRLLCFSSLTASHTAQVVVSFQTILMLFLLVCLTRLRIQSTAHFLSVKPGKNEYGGGEQVKKNENEPEVKNGLQVKKPKDLFLFYWKILLFLTDSNMKLVLKLM